MGKNSETSDISGFRVLEVPWRNARRVEHDISSYFAKFFTYLMISKVEFTEGTLQNFEKSSNMQKKIFLQNMMKSLFQLAFTHFSAYSEYSKIRFLVLYRIPDPPLSSEYTKIFSNSMALKSSFPVKFPNKY